MADEVRIIKKYANRRLYDTVENKYIAIDDIKNLVHGAVEFKVVDAQSGEDLTRSVLLQIIVDQEKNGDPILSTQLLEQIIRFYGDAMQTMVGSYLEKSIAAFISQQSQLQQQMEKLIQSTPQSIFADLAEKNLEIWQQMQDNFINQYKNSSQADEKNKK